MHDGLPPPTGWRLWWAAIRPRTLSIAVSPVVAGSALSWHQTGDISLSVVSLALLAALLIQAGTNLWNDLGDYLRGADQPQRLGPPRVTALGWATPAGVRRAALICFAAAALLGLFLIWRGGWPILILGAASLLAGWGYSVGPRPIAYGPWGEVCVVAFFGIGAVLGMQWLLSGTLSWAGLVLGVALGLPAAGVLMANNHRDRIADRAAGRRTLAIVLGADRSRLVYAALVLLPFPLLALCPGLGWLPWLVLPWALGLAWRFRVLAPGAGFTVLLAATARFQLALSVLIGVGLVSGT